MARAREVGEHHPMDPMRAMRLPSACCRFILACAAAVLGGCQSLPADEMAGARATVARASLAPLGHAPELARSQGKLDLAQRWIDARDYGPARWLAEQAEVDAEFAVARSAAEQALMALAAREQDRAAYRVSFRRP